MGEDKVAKLLSDNLAQEKQALQKMQTISKRLARGGDVRAFGGDCATV